MKRTLRILLIVCPALWGAEGLNAQTPSPPAVMYTYDNAGNRVLRSVLTVGGSGKLEDTTATEEAPPLPDELVAGSITAYPNPTGGLLYVAVSATLLEDGPGQYWLYDLSGRIMHEGNVTQTVVTLNLSNDAQGIYILRVMAGGKKEEWQVVRTP
ncbi:MAG: T9SS type A sorting domain-containing protein [Flavobacteriales bacterium]|nr:T9SS type A sorting domain-containing protein [Flavobacteriales bacterium]